MTLDYAKARELMVEQQIRPWDVSEPRVLETLSSLPREEFVREEHRTLAYADVALPLGHGRHTLKPVLEGRALQALSLAPYEDVLEIGTGSGFLTACLGRLAREVVSIEPVAELADAARKRLAAQNIANVRIEVADPTTWHTERRFATVCVNGAVARIPQRFIDFLQPGGRMFVVRGRSPAMEAVLVHNEVNGPRIESLFETDLPYLAGAAPAPTFEF